MSDGGWRAGFGQSASVFLRRNGLHSGDVHAAGEFGHFGGGLFLAFGDGFLDAFEDEFLEEFDVIGIEECGIDFDVQDVAGAGGADDDFVAADGGLNFAGGEFFLFCGEAGLHFLRLLHHFLYVHGGVLTVDDFCFKFFEGCLDEGVFVEGVFSGSGRFCGGCGGCGWLGEGGCDGGGGGDGCGGFRFAFGGVFDKI